MHIRKLGSRGKQAKLDKSSINSGASKNAAAANDVNGGGTTNPPQTLEQHIDSMMSTDVVGARAAPQSAAAPIDIFQGMPIAKRPLGGPASVSVAGATNAPTNINVQTAPVVPGKASKSLFTSVDTLQLSQQSSLAKPITVAIQSDTLAGHEATLRQSSATVPVSNGNPGEAVTIDRLARKDEYADQATDKAVDEIMATEGDALLAAEDQIRQRPLIVGAKPSRWAGIKNVITSKYMLLAIPLLILIVLAVPYTRYKVAAVFVHHNYTYTVLDSVTQKPVSGAEVAYHGQQAKTDAVGKAKLRVSPGKATLTVTKKYYKQYAKASTVDITAKAGSSGAMILLVATGRQVPFYVTNTLTGEPLGGITIKVLGTSAVTSKDGKITLVLPAAKSATTAVLTADGYNTKTSEIQITDSLVTANKLSVTPAGTVLFLSKAGGTLDVVKANLDGTGRTTAYAGTGKEDINSTTLTASRDWHYAVLKSSRDGIQNGLYLVDTITNKVTQFDTSSANYTAIGWIGHTFVYDVVKSTIGQSQSGREIIKSYKAEQQQLNQLDSNSAIGNAASYAYVTFGNFYIMDSVVVYTGVWSAGGTTYDLGSQNNVIRTVGTEGQAKKDAQTFAASSTTSVQVAKVSPSSLAYGITDTASSKSVYYSYTNQAVVDDPAISAATFNKTYPAYLASPDGQKLFWNEPRPAKQNLIISDKTTQNQSVISSSGEYVAYGWYGNQYVLWAGLGGGLYTVPVTGIPKNGEPVKVSAALSPSNGVAVYGGN